MIVKLMCLCDCLVGFRIMDKHLKTLSLKHVDTKFIRLDAEVGVNFSLCLVLLLVM